MVKKLVITLLLLLFAGCATFGIYYFFFRDTEELRIKRTFTELCDAIKKENDEGFLTAATAGKNIGKLFTDEIIFNLKDSWVSGVFSREDLIPKIFMARKQFRNLNMELHDIKPTVNGDQATVSFTAMVTGTLGNGDRIREVRDLRAVLKKDESGKWRFASFEIQSVIRQ